MFNINEIAIDGYDHLDRYEEEYYDSDNEIRLKLSDDMLLEVLDQQIQSDLITSFKPVNILDVFETRFNTILSEYEMDESVSDLIKNFKVELYSDLKEKLEKKLKLTFNVTIDDGSKFYNVLYFIYSQLILEHKKYLTVFISEYILRNITTFEKKYKYEISKNSNSYNALKKVYKNQNIIPIITKLDEVVKNVIYMTDDMDLFIRTIIESDPMKENYQMLDHIFMYDVIGTLDFIEIYFIRNNKDVLYEILADIKMEIIKHFERKDKDLVEL